MLDSTLLRLVSAGRRWGALGSLLALGACTGLGERLPRIESLVTPYQIDIVQGNVVTREQAQALKPGMPRNQVRDILGSPLVTSVFHAGRWDYVFSFRRQGQPLQQRKLAVFFKNDVLERVEADELPSEAEFVSSLDVRRKAGKAPAMQTRWGFVMGALIGTLRQVPEGGKWWRGRPRARRRAPAPGCAPGRP